MRIFISGGCKNGKSWLAQRYARDQGPLMYYIATMRPSDDEDRERIQRHQKDRDGWGFLTVERQSDILSVLSECDCSGSFLLDSTTALLANEMFCPDGVINRDAHIKTGKELAELLANIRNIVIVSDFIYSDAHIYDELTESYRKGLAYIDRVLVKACDIVLEVTAGNVICHKLNAEGGTRYANTSLVLNTERKESLAAELIRKSRIKNCKRCRL